MLREVRCNDLLTQAPEEPAFAQTQRFRTVKLRQCAAPMSELWRQMAQDFDYAQSWRRCGTTRELPAFVALASST